MANEMTAAERVLQDDDVDWGTIVEALIINGGFQTVWDELSEAGAGSEAAVLKVAELIRQSEWHAGRLCEETDNVIHFAWRWVSAGGSFENLKESQAKILAPENLREFYQAVAGQMRAIAAAYAVMGVIIGFGMASGAGRETEE